jgi:hypothetical protein
MSFVSVSKPQRKWLVRLAWLVVAGGGLVAAVRLFTAIPDRLPHLRADAASAWAAWVTLAIAIAAAVVGYTQVREARRSREEQAQPNVVLFTEPNVDVPQVLEIVIKNFGTTPAYDVKVLVNPRITSTPNLLTGDELADVPIPDFPILAPNQEWRTVWDSAMSRKSHLRHLQQRLGFDGFNDTDVAALTPSSHHTAKVTYTDSRKRHHETPSVLDFDQREGTTWVDIKTVHDLTQMLEKRLDTMNDGLVAIHRRLAEFGTEHEGVWIYGSGDDIEREYRRRVELAEHAQRQSLMDQLQGRRQHYHSGGLADGTADDNAASTTGESDDERTAGPSPPRT